MFKKYNSKEVGAYLSQLVLKNFKNERQFCKRCVELQNIEPTNEEIHKMQDRYSHIKKGNRNIQVEDLPIFCELLKASCEQILTAGNCFTPISGHITNYEIAFSDDPKVWEYYINHDEKLILNSDEYCKTILDYAIEFKNYKLLKYLIDNGYIWFVDNSKWQGYSFGAGTKIERREPERRDCAVPYYIQDQEKMRTNLVALAIENHDYSILDKLKARETPALYNTTNWGMPEADTEKYRNVDLIHSLEKADEKILDYFSTEFKIEACPKDVHTFMYPDLGEVIDLIVKSNRRIEAELIIRRILKHNQETYLLIVRMIKEAFEFLKKEPGSDYLKDYHKKVVYEWYQFNPHNNMVSYCFYKGKHDSMRIITNVFRITQRSSSPLINELIKESNAWFDKIATLKESEYHE